MGARNDGGHDGDPRVVRRAASGEGRPVLRSGARVDDALHAHRRLTLPRAISRLGRRALRDFRGVPAPGAGAGAAHLGGNQEPVPRVPARADDFVPADLPAVRVPVRDWLDAQGDPGRHAAGCGAVADSEPGERVSHRRPLAPVPQEHGHPAAVWRHLSGARHSNDPEAGGVTMWTRLLALIIKELLVLLRDPRSRVILIGPPVIQLIVFSFAATLEVKNVDVVILDRDEGTSGRELVRRIEGSPSFRTVTP